MTRLIAVAGFRVSRRNIGTGMTPTPIHQPNGMITQVAAGCGPGTTIAQWCLRGQNYHPPNPPSRPQVCAMVRRHLPSV
jgi:hypothetical protein